MSRKHPQNGPSFSKATTKAKPLTDAELAERQAYLKARENKILADAEASRARWKTVKGPNGLVSKVWRLPSIGATED